MIETMIALKKKLEPTLILQSVNDVTNCKRNQKEKQFIFAVFIKYTQLIQPGLNPGFKQIHGIRDQVLQQFWDQGSKFSVGSFGKKVYLITTLIFANYKVFSTKELILSKEIIWLFYK